MIEEVCRNLVKKSSVKRSSTGYRGPGLDGICPPPCVVFIQPKQLTCSELVARKVICGLTNKNTPP